LHIEEFPTAGLGIASGLCQELAGEFGVPIEVPALAVLATVGVCFGSGAQIAIGQGRSVAGNLFCVFGAAPGSAVPMVLDIVLDPLWSTHIDELREGDLVLRMVEYLDRRNLLHALANNAGAGLLFASENGKILRTLVTPDRSGPDLELLGRGLNRLPFVIRENRSSVRCPTPSLSLCVTAGPDDLQYFLSGFGRLPQLIRQACIVLPDNAAPGPIAACMSSPQEKNWNEWIFGLFDFARAFSEMSVFAPEQKASLEARHILAQFRNDVVTLADLLDGVARDQVLALPSLAARLCPSLILLQTRDWHQLLKVPAQIANVAVTMAKRFAGLQLAALLAAQGDPEGGLERVEEQTMLAKIKVRGGRVKRRDLYRGYAKQTSALHDPVIARLIAKELLSQEGSSWLVLTHQRVMQSS
jgi:hypothetical protein